MRTRGATTGTKADGFRRLEVITGVGRRRRWSEEDKARIVAESLDPATTSSAVARRYGLQPLLRRSGAAVPGAPRGLVGPKMSGITLPRRDGRHKVAAGVSARRRGILAACSRLGSARACRLNNVGLHLSLHRARVVDWRLPGPAPAFARGRRLTG